MLEIPSQDEANLLKPTAFVVSGGGGGITSEDKGYTHSTGVQQILYDHCAFRNTYSSVRILSLVLSSSSPPSAPLPPSSSHFTLQCLHLIPPPAFLASIPIVLGVGVDGVRLLNLSAVGSLQVKCL